MLKFGEFLLLTFLGLTWKEALGIVALAFFIISFVIALNGATGVIRMSALLSSYFISDSPKTIPRSQSSPAHLGVSGDPIFLSYPALFWASSGSPFRP